MTSQTAINPSNFLTINRRLGKENRRLILSLQTSYIHATVSSCQDIDHDACVNMAGQMPNMCADPNIGLSACPRYCNKCPSICYSCTTTSNDVSHCNPITCAVNQMCLRKTVVNTTSITYQMSCDTREICSRTKRYVPSFDIHCCGTDLCNAPPLPSTPATTQYVPTTSTSTPTSTPTSTKPPYTSSPTFTTQTLPTLPPSTSTSPSTTTSPSRAFTLSTRPPYTPYHLTTIPWIYFTTISLPYTLTTISQHHNQQSAGPYNVAPANQDLLHSINASCRSNVYVLVDESCSNYTFNHMVKHILHDMINQLDIRISKVHVALSTYNTSIYPHWNLDSYTQQADLQLAVDKLTIYVNGHSDNGVVVDHLLSNKATTDVVILFSNNRHILGRSNSRIAANDITQLHSMYRSIVIIGLDNAEIDDIDTMATNAYNIFSIPPYTHDYLVEWILNEICPALLI